MTVAKIISGGQAGADRGGLEAAIASGIPHGGWCPKGRRSEDGRVPARYGLTETDSPHYQARTLANVLEADATVIFVEALNCESGSSLTADLARKYGKPVSVFNVSDVNIVNRVATWLRRHNPRTLNVAGNRESVSSGIQARVRDILTTVIGRQVVTKVVNRRGGRTVFDVYVGRPSMWGNPYSTKSSNIDEIIVVDALDVALQGYERHLMDHPDLVRLARRELHGKRLGCWCVDDPTGTGAIVCHAQILARVADGAKLPILPARERGLSRLAEGLKKMGGVT